jgi:dienelactone hydrolase
MRILPVLLFAGMLAGVSGGALADSNCMSPDAAPAATVERTTFHSRGREIQGLLFRPARPNGAAIVLLHDREGLQEDLPRYEAQVGRLASCGYTVIAPSYYDAAGPRSRNDPRLGDKWAQVIDEAIIKVGSLEGVDSARVGVWGHGRGGGLALTNALDGIAAKAVVSVSGSARAEHGRGTPPILLIAGDHNPDAPLSAAEVLARELRRREVTVTVASVPATLPEFEPAAWDAVFEHSRAFFDAQLLGAGS